MALVLDKHVPCCDATLLVFSMQCCASSLVSQTLTLDTVNWRQVKLLQKGQGASPGLTPQPWPSCNCMQGMQLCIIGIHLVLFSGETELAWLFTEQWWLLLLPPEEQY